MPTVLLADDDVDHRELLALALARLGHSVVQSVDAESALLALAAGGIDAVLLDVRMPGISGVELCRRLRADPATADLPIMLVSADVNGSRIMAAMAAGADDYLTKPYHRAELGARLENLLARGGMPVDRPAVAAHAALLAARAVRPAAVPVSLERPLRRIA